jgi:uncharacterized protein YegL
MSTSPEIQQVPFSDAEFAENPEPRCPCILLLDISGSMHGQPIQQLNDGLRAFKEELAGDAVACKRVEIGIVTFGPVQVLSEFQTADAFQPPNLQSSGDTPMGSAILKALEMVEERKQRYKSNGVSYYRPWIFMITDGGPTDEWKTAAAKVREGEASRHFAFFAVGVEGAHFDVLKQIAVRDPLKLNELRFRDLFIWLSSSLSQVSRSQTQDEVKLDNPSAPGGWASV